MQSNPIKLLLCFAALLLAIALIDFCIYQSWQRTVWYGLVAWGGHLLLIWPMAVIFLLTADLSGRSWDVKWEYYSKGLLMVSYPVLFGICYHYSAMSLENHEYASSLLILSPFAGIATYFWLSLR